MNRHLGLNASRCYRQQACFDFSRERLRRVLRKKTSAELRLIYIFILTYVSAHLHILTSTCLLIFIFTHLHLCSCSHLHIYISAHLRTSHLHLTSLPLIYISHLHLSLFLTFSLKAGGSAAGPPRNATLCGDRARVGRAKCRRECDLSRSAETLCGDRACRVHETQARVRFDLARRNPLRRSCASDARNAGESAIWFCPVQPSAEIVHVECAKCRRECDLSRSGATLCGDCARRVREMQARVMRFGFVRRDPLRRSCVSSARNAGDSVICREMQARVRFDPVRRHPLPRSRVSSARNAGESAICVCPAQPSAQIVRVERAKCRRECDWGAGR